jgi:hypothetical protein
MMDLLVGISVETPPLIKYSGRILVANFLQRCSCTCEKIKVFQMSAGREKRRSPPFPLQPVTVEAPFQQWGMDVLG